MKKDPSLTSDSYWREHISIIVRLLAIWFVVSFGFGILLVDLLNLIPLGGYRLGFWFAQQGSLYTFVALIFVYARQIHKLDEKYDVHED